MVSVDVAALIDFIASSASSLSDLTSDRCHLPSVILPASPSRPFANCLGSVSLRYAVSCGFSVVCHLQPCRAWRPAAGFTRRPQAILPHQTSHIHQRLKQGLDVLLTREGVPVAFDRGCAHLMICLCVRRYLGNCPRDVLGILRPHESSVHPINQH